jgi:RNA polymerase sigma-70 factor (ECF subfamily)
MVFSLREINGLNVSETSSVLDISEANVKVRLNRAKAMLRTEIEKSYTAEELFEFNLCYCNPFTERVMSIVNKL